jgi:DNA polymerase-3 subunit alpha
MIVFPDTYKDVSSVLEGDEPVLVIGSLNKEEDNAKIMAKEIIPLSRAKERSILDVHFRLNIPPLTREHMEKLRDVLLNHRGNCNAFLHLVIPDESETIIAMGDDFQLNASDLLIDEVESLFGYSVTTFQS